MLLKCGRQDGRQQQNLETIQENIGRQQMGGSSTVTEVAVRKDLAGGSWRRQRNSYLDDSCRE